jgi:hypothetical protein
METSMGEREEKTMIGANTRVRLGVIGAVVAVVVPVAVTCIWWASAITAKVDSIATTLTVMVGKHDSNRSEIEDLKFRVSAIEKGGTPRLQVTEKELMEVRRMIEIHLAKETRP